MGTLAVNELKLDATLIFHVSLLQNHFPTFQGSSPEKMKCDLIFP